MSDDKFNSLGAVCDFVETQLVNKRYHDLFLRFDRPKIPSEGDEGGVFWSIEGDIQSVPGNIFLSIDCAAAQIIADKFLRQVQEEIHFPEMVRYYAKLNDDIRHGDVDCIDQRMHSSPNAISILMYGISEFAQEADVKLKMAVDAAVVQEGREFAWGVYLDMKGVRPSAFFVDQQRLTDGIDLISPERKPPSNVITGLNRIESFIHNRLRLRGNGKFIANATLTPFKQGPVVGNASELTQAGPARISGPEQWSIETEILEKLTDQFVLQIKRDVSANENLFGIKAVSPAARAILLFGIKFANEDNNPTVPKENALVSLVQTAIPTFTEPEATITREAENYARCINMGIPANEVAPDSGNTHAYRPGQVRRGRPNRKEYRA